MIATTIEQSKHLLELGIDINTADLLWMRDYDHNYNLELRINIIETYNPDSLEIIPAWSLDALINFMPNEIRDKETVYDLSVMHKSVKYSTVLWSTIHKTTADTTFDAAYDMICWLLENKYI